MSKYINQTTLMGNVGKEPEIRLLDNNIKVATFSLATSTGGYTKQDGTDVPEKTQWHNIVAWRGLAELAEKYIHKGDKILVQGSIAYREYDSAKDNCKKMTTDIIAFDISLCGGKVESSRPPQVTAEDAPRQEDAPHFPPNVDANGNTNDDLPF